MNPTLESHRRQVLDLLASLGLEATERCLEDEGSTELVWVVRHGSAVIVVRLLWEEEEGEEAGWFRLSSPLVFLPEKNVLPFYRRLLELNAELPGVALSVNGPVVELSGERPLAGMDREEAGELLHRVAACADKLDDMLAEEFGAPFWRPG